MELLSWSENRKVRKKPLLYVYSGIIATESSVCCWSIYLWTNSSHTWSQGWKPAPACPRLIRRHCDDCLCIRNYCLLRHTFPIMSQICFSFLVLSFPDASLHLRLFLGSEKVTQRRGWWQSSQRWAWRRAASAVSGRRCCSFISCLFSLVRLKMGDVGVVCCSLWLLFKSIENRAKVSNHVRNEAVNWLFTGKSTIPHGGPTCAREKRKKTKIQIL